MHAMKLLELGVIIELTSEHQIYTEIVSREDNLERHLASEQRAYKVCEVAKKPVGKKSE